MDRPDSTASSHFPDSVRQDDRMKPPLLFLLWLLFSSVWIQAQPTLSIVATDNHAAETWPGQTPNPGSVRITRTGSTATRLSVNVRLRGDAVLGEDFTVTPGFSSVVTFPVGQASLDFDVIPIDDLKVELSKFVRVEI